MITFVDTSAFVKLVVSEPGSDRVGQLWDAASVVVAARPLYVEARAALAAASRGGRLVGANSTRARRNLDDLWGQLAVVEVTGELVEQASDLADRRALRGYDAVHLAAALRAGAQLFVVADRRLAEAASLEGLPVADPTRSGPGGRPEGWITPVS